MSEVKALTYRQPSGYDVFWWPEFQALAKRLMIDLDAPITKIVITLPVAGEGLIIVESLTTGLDQQNKK